MFKLAELSGEIDVDALAKRIPARLVFAWCKYWEWKANPEASQRIQCRTDNITEQKAALGIGLGAKRRKQTNGKDRKP